MRDYLVLALIALSVPVSFYRPYFGILGWCVVSYLSPHRFTWGIAYNFPVAMTIGAATLAGLAFTKARRSPPIVRETGLLIVLWIYFSVTTLAAMNPEDAATYWVVTTKILFMTFVTLALVITREQFHYFLLTIALSVGFIGAKAGFKSILVGGSQRVYGPEGTFLGDNNDVALAMNMTLPLLWYLAGITSARWQRIGLRITFVLTIIAIIFTYSRGGFIGLVAVLLILLLRARRKIIGVLALSLAVWIGLELVPQRYVDRISTLSDYRADTSAMGRIHAWEFSWNVATDRPFTGGGFKVASPDTYRRYQPKAARPVDAHSIYFEMLGEHGFVALFLFIALLLSALASCRAVETLAERGPHAAWMKPYAQMLQASLLAYMVCGLFLSRAYFDLAYHLIAATVCLKVLAREAVRSEAVEPRATSLVPETA